MNGFNDGSKGNNISFTSAGEKPSSAEVKQMLRVIAALDMVRMSLGMYPPGHIKIRKVLIPLLLSSKRH